jgi:hypothetical protein
MRTLQNARGFGLLETMIAVGILGGVLAMSTMMIQSSLSARGTAGLLIRMQTSRSTVLATLQNDQSWTATVQKLNNGSLKCLRDQTDCTAAGGVFALYDSGGGLIYDSLTGNTGFSPQGILCTTFNPSPADPLCPVHLALVWEPVCPPAPAAGPCLNPEVRITGKFQFSGGHELTSINAGLLNFSFLRQKIYCPAAGVPFTLTTYAGPIVTGVNNVTASIATQTYPVGSAISSVVETCGTASMQFQYIPTYSGGAQATDPENQSSICFYAADADPATAPCAYEWVQSQGNWSLHANGAVVLTPTGAEQGMGLSVFQFTIHNAQMNFYLNGSRRFIFPNLSGYELKMSFRPGTTAYAPSGFSNINFSYQ